MKVNKIIQGNCLEVLKTFPDNTFDSCVTDPPYGINFMSKHWDYDVPKVEVWKEVLRVLKPGGFILCACGTRTQHRMAVNIEDAGFEIRDVITWHYGSGFPKSLSIDKSLDSLAKNKWLNICNGIDNLNKNNIFALWKNSLNNAKFAETQSERNIIGIGMNTQKNDSAQECVMLKVNTEKSYANALIAELNFVGQNLTSSNESFVAENAEQNLQPSELNAKSAELILSNKKVVLNNQHIIIAGEIVRDLLNENLEQTIKADEVLMTFYGNPKSLNEQTISVLCAEQIENLKHIIWNVCLPQLSLLRNTWW